MANNHPHGVELMVIVNGYVILVLLNVQETSVIHFFEAGKEKILFCGCGHGVEVANETLPPVLFL